MLFDLSVKVTKHHYKEALGNEKMASLGHLGTHFDVMNKEFPLEFTKRPGIVFDVSKICDKDIIENLCSLGKLLYGEHYKYFTANTYPINFTEMTGLPCRVVAEL